MSHHDRVTELYRGEIMSREASRICRDRIHWMCSRIRGQRVLDVGCSQGIASILAAREGYDVIGVDVDAEAIEYARAALADEPVAVRERVRFLCADIYSVDLGEDRFDTVLLGEILEHQTQPRRLLQRACALLTDEGLVVITTPFGLHVHDDHKSTLYLSDLSAVIEGLCVPHELDVVDGYIRCTAGGAAAPAGAQGARPDPLSPAELLALSERAFLTKEWRAYETLGDRARRIRTLSEQLKEAAAAVERHAERAETLAERADALAERADALAERADALDNQLRAARKQIDELTRTRKSLEARLRKATAAQAAAATTPQAKGATAAAKSGAVGAAIAGPRYAGGPLRRGLSALVDSVRRETKSRRIVEDPSTALRKSYARIRRAVLDQPVTRPVRPRPDRAPQFRPYRPVIQPGTRGIPIATILDTFSEHCFQYEARLVPLTRAGWRDQLMRERPALLLCESAWRGNGGEWKYLMTNYADRPDNPLRDVLAWCKQQGIPRVFWNKEDPANFDTFKDVAADFDYVFTTDADCIPRYRALLGHERVFALPFAAQPAIHNPCQDGVDRAGSVCFAGSWRADKYPERVADSEMLLGPALAHGLDIFDRYHGTADAEKFAFPEPYRRAVRGSLDYDRMLSAYRGYKVFLNVNSVKRSPTMCSRRVFELLACGTPVVTSESDGIRNLLGTLVRTVSSSEEAEREIGRLLADDGYRARMAHAGYRDVLTHHTYGDRLREILRQVGIADDASEAPLVTILAPTQRPDRLDNLVANIRRQIHRPIEVIVLLNHRGFDRQAVEKRFATLPNVQIHELPEELTLAECLNFGVDHASGEWIAKFDDDDLYGPHFLSDLLLARSYTDAPVLGKRSFFAYLENSDCMAMRFPGNSHRHVDFVHGATLVVRRDVFDQFRFTPVRQGTDTLFLRACRQAGLRVYSADPYNFIHVRHGDVQQHTWRISEKEFLSKCRVVRSGLDTAEVMI
ncbi:MAG: methyltransferase domain-containing protein [Deltaproteobacteria bacterium]|nr:MAG: methyltransferase domain-containing protein [Deltaproteobacteria bacterium]